MWWSRPAALGACAGFCGLTSWSLLSKGPLCGETGVAEVRTDVAGVHCAGGRRAAWAQGKDLHTLGRQGVCVCVCVVWCVWCVYVCGVQASRCGCVDMPGGVSMHM